LIAALILILLPLVLDIFRLNLVGKYLTYAFVAIGLVLCWGQTGILSLGQGLFFGLGGYCMAAFLKLEASSVANTKIQSTPGIPDFMDWNQLTALPYFWVPFKWLPFALIAVIVVPTILAFILGAALFKRRVGGVYFAIITQALALVMTILIVGQQGYTGGINGITDLRTLLGWDIRTDSAKYILYFVCCVLLLGTMFLARFVLASKLAASSSPCVTRRIASVSPATTWPTTRFLCSAWRPPWRASAGPCSRCKSALCRRPSSASCRPSIWSSSVRSAAATPSSARSPERSW
jgi:urea transport system permease protein